MTSDMRFRVYESGDVTDEAGSFIVTMDELRPNQEGGDSEDDLRAWLATSPEVGDVTPWGNTEDLPARRIA
jgi:hypothetical protein